jgi:hypothetical protein
MTPSGQIGVDRDLARAQPQLLQPADLGGGERLVSDVGQGRPTPQRERLARERGGRPVGVRGVGEERLKAHSIDAI